MTLPHRPNDPHPTILEEYILDGTSRRFGVRIGVFRPEEYGCYVVSADGVVRTELEQVEIPDVEGTFAVQGFRQGISAIIVLGGQGNAGDILYIVSRVPNEQRYSFADDPIYPATKVEEAIDAQAAYLTQESGRVANPVLRPSQFAEGQDFAGKLETWSGIVEPFMIQADTSEEREVIRDAFGLVELRSPGAEPLGALNPVAGATMEL